VPESQRFSKKTASSESDQARREPNWDGERRRRPDVLAPKGQPSLGVVRIPSRSPKQPYRPVQCTGRPLRLLKTLRGL